MTIHYTSPLINQVRGTYGLTGGYMTCRKDGYWHVQDRDGNVVTGLRLTQEEASEKARFLNAAAKLKRRTCLANGCKQEFLSEGAHHRMCDRCRSKTAMEYQVGA